ncbi:MAG TPA: DUF4190 domain-containing protein [Mycobacterium sp.]|nr:DUF4190 domain-containing protein [Mycobacterium sp.]
MTFQGGDFGGEGRDEAKQPPQSPEARPWEEFAPPAYAQPNPNAPKDPPPPAPPWTPPAADYPPPAYQPPAYPPPGNPPPPYPGRADYRPPGYPDARGYGGPSYPPPPPQYGQPYPPPSYGGGYGGPPGYPGPYDSYPPYRDRSHETNGLAIGSLVTSVAGGLLGIPLAFVCYIGILMPVVGAVLGVVALSQIKRTNQQGRGLAIAGIVIGAAAAVLLVLLVLEVMAAAHSPSMTPSFT